MRTLGRRIVFRRSRNVRSKQNLDYFVCSLCEHNPHRPAGGAPFKRGFFSFYRKLCKIPLTCNLLQYIMVTSYKEVIIISPKSRAEYMKQRRKATKAFYVDIDIELAEKLDKCLQEKQKTKKQWLLEKIGEELGQNK